MTPQSSSAISLMVLRSGQPRRLSRIPHYVAQGILNMYPHQRGRSGFGLAAHQRQVHRAIDVVLHANQPERTEFRVDPEIGDGLHRFFLGQPVADEIRDGADLEAVAPGEPKQIVASGHGAVLVEDLDDHRRRFESRQTHQVAARLGVPGARQYAARLRPERKHVAGLLQVLGFRVGCDCRPNRSRPVMGGDSRRDPFGRFNGQSEVRHVAPIGFADHQRQTQLLATFPGQRQTDQSAAVARHEIHVGGACPAGGHDQVALVLAGFIVHDDDHPAFAQVGDDFLGRVQAGDRCFPVDWNSHEIRISLVVKSDIGGPQPFQVASDDVHLNINSPSGPVLRKNGHGVRMRNDVDFEGVCFDRVDGQTHAIHRHRPLAGDIAHQRLVEGDAHPGRTCRGFYGNDAPDPIDVPGDQVAVHGIAQPQGALQVHGIAPGQLAQGRCRQGFKRHIRRKPLLAAIDRGQADAVHGNAAAGFQRRERNAPDVDGHAPVSAEIGTLQDSAYAPYDSAKHAVIRRSLPTLRTS